MFIMLNCRQSGQGSNRLLEFHELDPATARQQLDKLTMRQDSHSASQLVLRSNR